MIYRYHSGTGEYLGSGQGQSSPSERGEELCPANATKIAPPVADEGCIVCWNGAAWQQVLVSPEPLPDPIPEPTERERLEGELAMLQQRKLMELIANDPEIIDLKAQLAGL